MTTLPKLITILFTALAFGLLLKASSGSLQDRERNSGTLLAQKPIALDGDELGNMLRKWFSQGTAAGNIGDYYDNRDGGHSQLDLRPYPQLRQVEYTDAQIKARQNWGLQGSLLPYVVFGNSSTSSPPEAGGSNPRIYYGNPRGLDFLFAQYARNNLYIYPEHRDHDPGHNGLEGYGDLFPTNTPYLIISQGSSGSDQPFMRSFPYVLAAFRPEVKQKLIRTGLLMPVIQMLMRFTNKQISEPGEYITGKAHPTVFEGNDLNPRKMVEIAHEITLSDIPPMALIKVIKEDLPVNGVDYFEPERTEKLADTPAVVARLFRGSGYLRKIILSTEDSKDLNGRPLKFFWTILRGDAGRIKIEYRNPSHSIAEITIPYHDRFPVAGTSGLESNRVDIGVFAHNGAYYSPPAFLTFYTLDSEARTYAADGRLLDIGYGAGKASVSVSNWDALFKTLTGNSNGWPEVLLRRQFNIEEMTGLMNAAEEYRKAHAVVLEAREREKKAAADQKPAAHKALEIAAKSEEQVLEKKLPKLNLGASALMQRALNSLLKNPELWIASDDARERSYQSAQEEDRKALDAIRQLLFRFGVAEDSGNKSWHWTPIRKGAAPLDLRLTRYERSMVERFNAVVLQRLAFPGIITSDWRINYVDSRLASSKAWRDVYRYSPDGILTGWQRYQSDGIKKFNAEGLLVLEEDAQGRCLKAQRVQYEIASKTQPSDPLISGTVYMLPIEEFREYEYSSPNDWKGHPKIR